MGELRPLGSRVGRQHGRRRASSSDSALDVSAFRDRDGSRVIEILNTGTADEQVLLRGVRATRTAAYVTGDSAALTPQTGPLAVPARSLLTVVVGSSTGRVRAYAR